MRNLIIGTLLFTLGQSLIWIQTNGQFIWPWFKKNPWLISFGFGGIISYILIQATAFVATYYDGMVWPGRFIGFSTGIFVFTLFTYYLLGEGVNLKTAVSLLLATALIAVQLFWK